MITKESIDRVLDVDLIEILEKYQIQGFKKAGVNYKGFSPFTSEKSPSFMASKVKQVWKDFSTGNGGVGPISFVMAYEKLSWIEAVEKVASLSNIILQREHQTDEEIEIQNRFEKQRKLLQEVSVKYLNNFVELPTDHWAKEHMANRGYQDITHDQFQIGYSLPNSNEITSPLKEKGRLRDGIEVGLVKEAQGDRTYDFNNDRIMFPIHDVRGRVIGFGGRASNEKAKTSAKYLNSPDTKHYDKKTVLYGLFQGRAEIIRRNQAYLTEGYTDVIAFHDKNVSNTVATCGTALTPEHVLLFKKKLCSHVIIVRDGDKAGQAACYRDIDLLLEASLKVSVVELPDGEDPDTMAKEKGEELQAWLDSNTYDALHWKALRLFEKAETAHDKSDAVTNIAESLLKIKDEIKRKEYAKECAKKLSVSAKDMTARITQLHNAAQAIKKLEKKIYDDEKTELVAFGFPQDGDVVQFKRDGYVISPEEMSIYFKTDREYFMKGTNFVINPLFVVRSAKGEGKRLIEFCNKVGENTVFALNNKEISNFGQFKEKIVDGFNFTFESGVSNVHFTQFRNRLLYNFRTAHELYTLGQQPEGFYAFANGVVYNSEFFPVDDYGIVDVVVKEADEEKGIEQKIETFYSPAFSKINLGGREDDDAFEGVREFAFKPSEIVFNQWMDLMYKVYGEKAMVGIAFVVAATFRDIIVNQFSTFPHLFLTGQRQSGKTTFSESLTWVFTPGKKSFDLNTGTMVGFFRMVSRIKNIAVGLEEFTDQIHEAKFQTLKAAFDNRGRETGNVSGDKSTTVTKVQSACIILSQYLSTRDDNSLTSRSITMAFQEANYNPEQKITYGRLKSFERKGMTSMLLELLKYRTDVELSLSTVIEELNRDLVKTMDSGYMERMLNNFISVMAPMKILWNKFSFPFTWDEFYSTCQKMIVSSSDMISETEGTAKFWQILEFLVDQKRIHRGVEFIIEPKATFTIRLNKKETKQESNPQGDRILFLRLGKVHQDYLVEVSRRKGEEPIGESTLRGYFLSKTYFIGMVPAMHFENGSGSCYAFNYDMMEKMGMVNLVRDFKVPTASPGSPQHTPGYNNLDLQPAGVEPDGDGLFF
ncbi:DNA primase [Flavobacterium hauense]